MAEQSLKRIPFGPAEVQTITSAGWWLRLMAGFQLVMALAFVVLLGLALSHSEPIAFVSNLLVGGVTLMTYLGVGAYLLLRVAGNLQLVAVTDVADQAYLATAVQQLRTYFFLEVFVGVVTLVDVVLATLGTF